MPGEDAGSSVGSDAASTMSDDQGNAGPVIAGEDQPDLLKNEASFQDAIFGVLFTISKEKLINSWKYGLSVIILDVLQLLVFNLEDGFPWTFPKDNWAYHLFTDFQLQRLALRGGELVYLIFFWLLTAVVVVSAALCLFVAHNFKTNNFPYIWPIKLLRFTVSIFFEMLYISSLAMFSVAFDCRVIHESLPFSEAFPEKACFKMPIILIAIVGAIMLLISAAISFLQSVAATELDPDSRDLLALAHSSASIKMWVLKTTVTIFGEIISDYHKLQGILLLLVNIGLLWIVVRNVPYYNSSINCFQGALYSLLTWQALILFALVWNDDWAKIATYVMLIGQPFAFCAGWSLIWTRLFYAGRIASRFKDARAAGVLRVRHRFRDDYEVEICARCARKKDPDHQPIMAWVDAADMMYTTGLEQYPESVFLHIAYANFLSTYRKSAATQMIANLAIAKKCDPGLSERFNLFTKEREHSQANESDQSGEGAKDLVSIVEFQTNLKLVLQAHSDTLRDIRGFWRELCSKKTTFASLSEAFTQMHQSETRSEEIYKIVIQKYPKSVKILRAYVRFLREIKNDPWKAQKYDLQADNYEQAQMEAAKEAQFAANIGVGGDLSNLLSEDNPDGVVMITEDGKITFVNKKVETMFGYSKSEMNGKNVAMLMPPPFSMQHHTFLRSYKQTQKGNLLGTGPREVIGAHKDGYVFPVKVTIEKSVGADGYTGIFYEVHSDPRAGIAWISGEGQLYCVSKGFMSLLGYSFQDLRRSIHSIGANEDLEKQLVLANQKCSDFFAMMKKDKEQALLLTPFEFEVPIKHKYGAIVTCKVSVRFSGAEDLRLLSCTFTFSGENAKMGLLTADVTGKILYANAMFEAALHFSNGYLAKGHNLSELLPTPHAGMHNKWLQAAMRPKTLPMAPSSCRNGKVVLFSGHKGREVPMKLTVTLGDLMGHRVWNAMAEPLEIPIGVSGGGFGPLRIPNIVAATKRLRLMVRQDGVIVGAAADNAWALNALGVDPSKIIHQPLAQYLDVFADVSKSIASGRLTPTLVTDEGPIAPNPAGAIAALLEKLDKHSSALSGTQHGPITWSSLWALPAPPGGRSTSLPILMELPDMAEEEIDVQEACDAGLVDREDLVHERTHVEYHVCAIDIWRTDVLEAIMEVDGNCNIKHANKDACTMFGYPVAGMKSLNLSRLFQLADILPKGGEHAGKVRVEDFLEMKKTQLKGAKAEAVTDKKNVNASHADGAPLVCTVQGIDKHGDGLRFLLRITASVTEASGNLDRIRAKAVSEKPMGGLVHQGSRRPGAPAGTDADQIEPASEEDAVADDENGDVDPTAQEDEEVQGNVKADQASVADSIAAGSKAMDDKRHEEFARAKQFRKLSKLLNTPEAKRPITQFRNFAIAVLAILVIIQVVTFILDRVLITKLNKLSQIGFDTVTSLTFTVQINYCATVLWAALDSYAPPAWNSYSPVVIGYITAAIASQMNSVTATFNALLNDAFLNPVNSQVVGFFVPGTSTDYYETRYIDVDPTPYYVSERSALEKTQAIFVRSAYQVAQLPASHRNNLSFWEPYRFIDDNALMVVLPAVNSFASMVFAYTNSSFNQTKELLLVLLVVYAIAIMAALSFLMMFLVRRAAKSRLRLFSIFTALPRPTVMALASQSISVTGGSNEDEEEEAWQQANATADTDGKKEDTDKGPKELQSTSDSDAPQGLSSKKVNYHLSTKRQLTGMGYGMYTLVLPFFAWMIVLVAVYSHGYITTNSVIGPATASIYANELNLFNLRIDLAAQKLVLATSNQTIVAERTELVTAAKQMVGIMQAVIFGSESLKLPSGLLNDAVARHILLDPICLRQDSANCLPTTSPFYSSVNQGLEAAINNYASAAITLASQPPSAFSINNSYVLFIASEGATDIYEGIDTLAKHMISKVKSKNSELQTIEVIVLIVLLVAVPIYYWYMLQPFYKRLGKESRRVAELLSQLPKSIDVQGMVAEAMAVQLPSSKSAPVPINAPKKRSFWRFPFMRHRGPAYQSLKDVDSPVKGKGSQSGTANEDTDDAPLLKAGDPTKAKYQEKLSRRAAFDDSEPFVPRPNTRIKFQLPNSTPPEDSPRATAEQDTVHAPDSIAEISGTPETNLLTGNDTALATDLIPAAAAADAGAAVGRTSAPANAVMPADDGMTLI